MKIKSEFLVKLGGFTIASLARIWMGTLNYRGAMYDPDLDPISQRFQGPAIFLVWHEYILCPFYLRGHCDISMLMSKHSDGEILTQAARHMGFGAVRGSSSRGGVQALREIFRRSDSLNLAITPDGPRGPRRELAMGPVYLSSRLGLPLIPLGFGYDRPWRVERAWDKCAIPRPYSQARSVVGPAIQVPPKLDRAALEPWRRQVESTLNFVTIQAEQWAASGAEMVEQAPLRREPRPLPYRMRNAA